LKESIRLEFEPAGRGSLAGGTPLFSIYKRNFLLFFIDGKDTLFFVRSRTFKKADPEINKNLVD
jgi:hypothetical protein